MMYRAILHNATSGSEKVESIWVDDYREAKRMGETGLSYYGGSHYTIEDNEENAKED